MSLRRLMASPSDPVRVMVPGPEPKFLDFCLSCYTMLLRSLLTCFIFLLYILVLVLNAHIDTVGLRVGTRARFYAPIVNIFRRNA